MSAADNPMKEQGMERIVINPWTWKDHWGYVDANEIVAGGLRTVYVSGMGSVDDDGAPVCVDDMAGQMGKSLDNLERMLGESGLDLSHVVRLNMFTTDVDRFIADYQPMAERLIASRCRPACTLLGVTRLAFPQMLLEIEATAVAEA